MTEPASPPPETPARIDEPVPADGKRRRRLWNVYWQRRSPWHWGVALPVLLNLFVLGPQLSSAPRNSDLSLHLAMVRWASEQFAQGKIPLDGWFPTFGLGASQFHHYQSLPAILTAAISGPLGVTTTFFLLQYLLAALWPLCIYGTARLLDRPVPQAACAAAVSCLVSSAPGFGYEFSSYFDLGLWTQLWGMWFLPLAWGFSWRAVRGEGRVIWAAVFIALTIASHFMTAYLALIAVPVMVIVSSRHEFRAHALRGAGVVAGAFALSLWVLAPLLADSAYSPDSVVYHQLAFTSGTYTSDPGAYLNSFGIGQVLAWLGSGDLFDAGRPIVVPMLSLTLLAGLLAVLRSARTDASARFVVAMFVVSIVLFSGPASFFFLRWIPGSADMDFHRFIAGVHLVGIFAIGIGAVALGAWTWRIVSALWPREWPQLRVEYEVLLLIPAVALLILPARTYVLNAAESASAVSAESTPAATRELADFNELVADVRTLGGGRVYAGTRYHTTDTFQLTEGSGPRITVDGVPAYMVLSGEGVPVFGFDVRAESLATDAEVGFDDQDAAQYTAYNVRYVILPSSWTPAAAWSTVASRGEWRLYQVAPTRYLQVVDTIAPAITENRSTIGTASQAVMRSADLGHSLYHPVAYNGGDPAQPTLPDSSLATTPAGIVSSEADDLENGEVVGTVSASRTAVALLSVSYDPRWTVTVDGQAAQTEMIAPALAGVQVSAGKHVVRFTYQPSPWYWLWTLIALLGLVVMARTDAVLARWRRFRQPSAT